MALFRTSLDRQEEEINARINLINKALHELDYQVGTYIESFVIKEETDRVIE